MRPVGVDHNRAAIDPANANHDYSQKFKWHKQMFRRIGRIYNGHSSLVKLEKNGRYPIYFPVIALTVLFLRPAPAYRTYR